MGPIQRLLLLALPHACLYVHECFAYLALCQTLCILGIVSKCHALQLTLPIIAAGYGAD